MHLDMTKTAFLAAILSLSIPSLSTADELVPIGTILDNATSISLHVVAFQGTVKELEPVPPFPTPGCVSYHRYKVVVQDETGSIYAILCGDPVDSTGNIVEGDHVRIWAVIEVLSSESVRPAIQATVKRIERITSQQ